MVDSVVGGLAPDVFRVMDHNGDDDLSKQEWVKFLDTITTIVGASSTSSPSTPNTPVGGGGSKREASEQVIDLVFTRGLV